MSTNKRTKIASQQMRMCACGKQFTSRAYGRHVVDCLPFHNLTTTRQVYHVAATNHAANAAPQQQNLTMHQQRQWINRGKVNVESSAIEQRHNEHKVTYNNHLKRLDTWAYACPAQIHGFIRFDTGGVRTPRLLQNVNADMVNDSEFIDETMYVVVRTHKDFLSWRELEKQFVVPIQLGNLDDCTYILPVSRIVNPLYVFEDHGQPENTSNTSFFATLPARYSAFHLDYKLNPQLIPGEGGLSQKCEEV